MNRTMKKITEILMTAVMSGSLCACQKDVQEISCPAETEETAVTAEPEVTAEPMIVGGWTIVTGDTSINAHKDAKAAFEKAVKTNDGFAHEPLALLATQVVSGTNYCMLCRGRFARENAPTEMMIVYVYEDLEGNAETTGIKVLINVTDALGNWTANEGDISIEQHDSVKAAFDKVFEGFTGASYEPVAYIGSQLVSGTNYMVLCRETIVVPDAKSSYALVTVYEDLNGNVVVKDIEALELGETDEELEVINSQLCNPFLQYETLEEAESAAGFEMTIPQGYETVFYRVMNSEMIEIVIDDRSAGKEVCRIRKAEGSDDISGDYGFYNEVKDITADGRTVTLKGNDGKIYTALWNDQGYAYSLSVNDGLSEEEITALITQIR